jgi:hypothetical protein
MRLVGIALVGALLSGCALQAGDPASEETGRPGELVAEPGGGGGPREALQASPNDPLGDPLDQTPSSPRTRQPGGTLTTPAAVPGSSGSSSGGGQENPNPSPWNSGLTGNIHLQAPPASSGSSE